MIAVPAARSSFWRTRQNLSLENASHQTARPGLDDVKLSTALPHRASYGGRPLCLRSSSLAAPGRCKKHPLDTLVVYAAALESKTVGNIMFVPWSERNRGCIRRVTQPRHRIPTLRWFRVALHSCGVAMAGSTITRSPAACTSICFLLKRFARKSYELGSILPRLRGLSKDCDTIASNFVL